MKNKDGASRWIVLNLPSAQEHESRDKGWK
jgi:hypothetical protein